MIFNYLYSVPADASNLHYFYLYDILIFCCFYVKKCLKSGKKLFSSLCAWILLTNAIQENSLWCQNVSIFITKNKWDFGLSSFNYFGWNMQNIGKNWTVIFIRGFWIVVAKLIYVVLKNFKFQPSFNFVAQITNKNYHNQNL